MTPRGSRRSRATVARLISNGSRFMQCDRCTQVLVASAECYQIASGRTVWIHCARCHRQRNMTGPPSTRRDRL